MPWSLTSSQLTLRCLFSSFLIHTFTLCDVGHGVPTRSNSHGHRRQTERRLQSTSQLYYKCATCKCISNKIYNMFIEHDHRKRSDSGMIAGTYGASQWPNHRIITPSLHRVRVPSTKNPQRQTHNIKNFPQIPN